LPGMGYDLKHFVVEWDQQYNEDEQAGKGGVGVVVRKSDVTVRKTSAVARPSFHDDDHPMCAGQSGGIDLRHCHPFLNEICRKNPWSSAPVRRRLAARREPASALDRRVERLPMHTHTHGGQSGHFDLSARHPTPNEPRSPERPQNGPYDRTVSAPGACFGNLTPAGETVAFVHPARWWACAQRKVDC